MACFNEQKFENAFLHLITVKNIVAIICDLTSKPSGRGE